MNLDDQAVFERLDPGGVIAGITRMPDRLEAGWQDGLSLPLPEGGGSERVALWGKGESAAAVDLLAACAAPVSPIPMIVLDEGPLPAWVRGPGTLGICLEPFAGAEPGVAAQMQDRGCQLVAPALQGAGELAYDMGRLLAVFYRRGLLSGVEGDLHEAVQALRAQQETLRPETPVARNPAKRMAGQLMGRWVVVFGSGMLAPVARRWKAQLNTRAKALAQFETLSESDRGSPGALNVPEALLSQVIALFLQAPSLPERSLARLEYTRQAYMVQGMNTDAIEGRGKGLLAHLLTLLHYGEYTAYYLTVAYGEDPAPASVLAALEEELDRLWRHP